MPRCVGYGGQIVHHNKLLEIEALAQLLSGEIPVVVGQRDAVTGNRTGHGQRNALRQLVVCVRAVAGQHSVHAAELGAAIHARLA